MREEIGSGFERFGISVRRLEVGWSANIMPSIVWEEGEIVVNRILYWLVKSWGGLNGNRYELGSNTTVDCSFDRHGLSSQTRSRDAAAETETFVISHSYQIHRGCHQSKGS